MLKVLKCISDCIGSGLELMASFQITGTELSRFNASVCHNQSPFLFVCNSTVYLSFYETEK